MKCPAMVSVPQAGLEAGFSAVTFCRQCLPSFLLKQSISQPRERERRQHQEENHRDDVLPHKVQQVKDRKNSLESTRNTSHPALMIPCSNRITGKDRRNNRDFWAGKNLGIGWETVGKRLKSHTLA